MNTINIEILNPKAKKLIQDLADLNLISIKPDTNVFFNVVKKNRSKKATISMDQITREVELVRKKRNGK